MTESKGTHDMKVGVELLPCPFCGSAAMSGTTLDGSGYAMCVSEGCWGMTGYLPSEAEAIAAWNLRAAKPADGWQDVFAERQRQISVEGWTPEHDDRHNNGEIALAAAAYAYGSQYQDGLRDAGGRPNWWPWGAKWWKPKNRRRDLVKAGALILAEIDRLDRLPAVPQETSHEGK